MLTEKRRRPNYLTPLAGTCIALFASQVSAGDSLLASSGQFDQGMEAFTVYTPDGKSEVVDGEIRFTIQHVSELEPWRVQLVHEVALVKGQRYSLCFDAKADAQRMLDYGLDSGAPEYSTRPYGGGRAVELTPEFQRISMRFSAGVGNPAARVSFNMGQHEAAVTLDNIGLYDGLDCGVEAESE